MTLQHLRHLNSFGLREKEKKNQPQWYSLLFVSRNIRINMGVKKNMKKTTHKNITMPRYGIVSIFFHQPQTRTPLNRSPPPRHRVLFVSTGQPRFGDEAFCAQLEKQLLLLRSTLDLGGSVHRWLEKLGKAGVWGFRTKQDVCSVNPQQHLQK